MNFGLVEAFEKAFAAPTAELRQFGDTLVELLQGITAEQRRTNELLEQLVTANKKPVRTPAKKEAPSDQ